MTASRFSSRFRPRLPSRDSLLTIAAGGLAACGFQPLGLWPLTLAAFAFLIHRLHVVKTWRQALLTGWLFGVGHFTVGNGWIATAFTYQAEMPTWLGWIAVVLLALYLAVFPALATWGGWWLAHTRRAMLLPAFAAAWIVSEWLRSWMFTGFAWNPLAMVTLGGFDRPGWRWRHSGPGHMRFRASSCCWRGGGCSPCARGGRGRNGQQGPMPSGRRC